jgi:NAD+ diphosphatase
VIVLVTDDDDRALLGHNGASPAKRYSTLAGFVEPGESLEAAVAREVHEEVGVDVADVTYAGSQPWPFPSSLMVGFYARARSHRIHVDGEEITDARWFARDELAALAASGDVLLPSQVSIARLLVEGWYGGAIATAREW